jgi:hypothetical protein
LPLLERVRVEVYLPDPHNIEYDKLLRTLEREFTFACGGCTIVRGVEGNFLSRLGVRATDQINLIYADLPMALSTDFPMVAAYAGELKRVATEALLEETVLVTVEAVFHTV